MRFDYTCPRCHWHTVSDSPDLQTCPIPVFGDGEPVILPPVSLTYDDYSKCGGDLDECGPHVFWFDLPESVRDSVIATKVET